MYSFFIFIFEYRSLNNAQPATDKISNGWLVDRMVSVKINNNAHVMQALAYGTLIV